jgi:hypothetical protein
MDQSDKEEISFPEPKRAGDARKELTAGADGSLGWVRCILTSLSSFYTFAFQLEFPTG